MAPRPVVLAAVAALFAVGYGPLEAKVFAALADGDHVPLAQVAKGPELVASLPRYRMPAISDAGFAWFDAFRARETDVVVSTFSKTGTTWLLHLCHLLRGGGMDFADQDDVTPWLLMAYDGGAEKRIEADAGPRVFKSHSRLSQETPGARYVVSIRDPVETLESFYSFGLAKRNALIYHYGLLWIPVTLLLPRDWANFLMDTLGSPLTLDEFARHPLMWEASGAFGGSLFDHYAEYWLARKSDRVLVVDYAKLQREPRAQVERLAHFLGGGAAERVDHALALSSKARMAQDRAKFEDRGLAKRMQSTGRATLLIRSILQPSTKVGEKKAAAASEQTRALLREQWQRSVTPITGHENYEAMAADF